MVRRLSNPVVASFGADWARFACGIAASSAHRDSRRVPSRRTCPRTVIVALRRTDVRNDSRTLPGAPGVRPRSVTYRSPFVCRTPVYKVNTI